jgi:hypothetical protein
MKQNVDDRRGESLHQPDLLAERGGTTAKPLTTAPSHPLAPFLDILCIKGPEPECAATEGEHHS